MENVKFYAKETAEKLGMAAWAVLSIADALIIPAVGVIPVLEDVMH